MNILVICQYFPPENKIGAIRPSRIAKYLNRYEDVNVSVLTVVPLSGCPAESADDYCGVRVFRAAPSSAIVRINRILKRGSAPEKAADSAPVSPGEKTGRVGLKQRIRGKLFRIREKLLDYSYYHRAIRILGKIDTSFDALISTYNTEFGHKVALWYKKRHPEVRWITDYRDPLWGAYSSPEQKKHGTEFVRRVSDFCDAVTVVSKGIIDIHREDFNNKPVYVIPNGYDTEDTVPASGESSPGPVRIVYTGELYNGKRDLTPLFEAVNELEQEKKIASEDIEVIYAGKSGSSFLSQISRFPGIKSRNLGFVSREEALAMQSGADILLLASWCEPNEKDVLTGKFFEYLQKKKPIICIISGSASGCALTGIINDHSLGCSYEAASREMDHGMLCSYIEKQVSAKKAHGQVEFIGDDEYVKKFDYESIAGDFYEIISCPDK
jgi:glycosyltransferase involved in cell wall biosynthesis